MTTLNLTEKQKIIAKLILQGYNTKYINEQLGYKNKNSVYDRLYNPASGIYSKMMRTLEKDKKDVEYYDLKSLFISSVLNEVVQIE